MMAKTNFLKLALKRPCKGILFPLSHAVRFFSAQKPLSSAKYDAIVVGGGHNGLVAAAFLQKSGLNVLVLEKRHVVGGAAVTEEMIPGFKFSRCSYVLSLLRPKIIEELRLKEHGLKVHFRDPNSFVPLKDPNSFPGCPKFLLLGADMKRNQEQIGQFSKKDAIAYPLYEKSIAQIVEAVLPILETPPPNFHEFSQGSIRDKFRRAKEMLPLLKVLKRLGKQSLSFYELMTTPASKFLDTWFESEPLKATLATDAVIGAMLSPHTPGSSYVFLHHLVGQSNGVIGAWGYPEGGMGAVSNAIANAATSYGVTIRTDAQVDKIIVNDKTREVNGVVLKNGEEVKAKVILSNATPEITFNQLIDKNLLPSQFVKKISKVDYTSPVTKINVAVDSLPNFKAAPSKPDGSPSEHHRCTIHLNCESIQQIHDAFIDAQRGRYSDNPIIEMCIPSSLDNTIAPPGKHVVSLFIQYTPYDLTGGGWNMERKEKFADKIFDIIEEYAPGFHSSVIGRDILTPPDLERIFGLTGGNIFHGAISLDQLYFMRPIPSICDYRTPVKGLYLCGSGAHPGGGVMGAPGYNSARTVARDLGGKIH